MNFAGLSIPVELIIPCFVFALVFALGLLLLIPLGRGGELDQTRELLRRMARPIGSENEDVAILRENRRDKNQFLDALLSRFNLLQRLEQYMWQAGLYMRVSEVLLIMLLLFGAGLAAGAAWLGDPISALGCGGALSILPLLYIRFRGNRRLKIFAQQLPEVLDLLKSSLEAGHSLLRGLQVVVDEFPDPASGEIRMVLEQARLGVPLPRALEDMLKRVPEESLRFLVVAVKIQADVGSSLANIIGRLSETLRNRQRVQLQIQALTAQSRMSGMVVAVLPVIVLGAFSMIQPGYAHPLFYDPFGVKLLKVAIGLDVMAFLTIRRILRMDY
ncbi:MAG: type II secretion system F family protein [Candidatus Binataceae bacterium]|jgi:tight adherence protein B